MLEDQRLGCKHVSFGLCSKFYGYNYHILAYYCVNDAGRYRVIQHVKIIRKELKKIFQSTFKLRLRKNGNDTKLLYTGDIDVTLIEEKITKIS